jgi:hypothetical protein
MPLREILKTRLAILVGLMTIAGLVGAASQQPADPKLATVGISTEQSGAIKPIIAHIDNGVLPTPANLPINGVKLPGSTRRGNPLWRIPLTSLTSARERPIFSPTRRPRPIAVKSVPIQAPIASQPLLTLVGAIAGENEGIGIFYDETAKRVIRLKTGETHMGWTLRLVKGREATLQTEQRTAILALPNPPAK